MDLLCHLMKRRTSVRQTTEAKDQRHTKRVFLGVVCLCVRRVFLQVSEEQRREIARTMLPGRDRPPGLLVARPRRVLGMRTTVAGVTLTRDRAQRVELTSLWRKDLFAGIGGERAVVCFLRHFG